MSTCASAGGKVLLAGGYLVLDPKYSGVVVSTSSRFYSVVTDRSSGTNRPKITVRSPQFKNATWEYDIIVDAKNLVSSESQTAKNKFVETALQGVLGLARDIHGAEALSQRLGHDLDVSILGDNDFYSQRAVLDSLNLPPTSASLASLPRFAKSTTTLGGVHKTGLGSSAALISSLVIALLVHLGIPPRDQISEEGALSADAQALAHNTAQYVHCLAQGKIGSGFDVAAAIYGSHLYTRFDPSVLEPLMGADSAAAPVLLLDVLSPSNPSWKHKISPFHLPPYLRMVLADVDAGSDTPSLVSKVLKWRASAPTQANELWDKIAADNNNFAGLMNRLASTAEEDSEAYIKTLEQFGGVSATEWASQATSPAAQLLTETRRISEKIRAGMRSMGDLAGVPIEPKEQTTLLDACLAIPGVVAGGVPGAGGYDAIWLLVIDTKSEEGMASASASAVGPKARVEALWGGWKEMNVSPLGAAESRTGGAGVRVEAVDSVPGLREALGSPAA